MSLLYYASMMHQVRAFRRDDLAAVSAMRQQLFPDCSETQQLRELSCYLDTGRQTSGRVGDCACFVVTGGHSTSPYGFAEVMMRSHAEGCWEYTANGQRAIAYLEAWWVQKHERRQGAGRALVRACELWAQRQGSPMLASDAELENIRSQAAHVAVGFSEVERAVHFVKKLDDDLRCT